MILTPELAGLAASRLGVLGLILRKARCFIRPVGNSWDGGVGFCAYTIVPPPCSQMNGTVDQTCVPRLNPNPIDTGRPIRTSAKF